jgi:hypothetical protein
VREMLMKIGVLRIVRYNLRSFWELTVAVHAAVCGGSNRRTLKCLILQACGGLRRLGELTAAT